MPGDTRDYAAMVTPVTSAQVAKAWVRPDRSFAAVPWSRRRGKTLATWAEQVVGEAFAGRLPDGVRVTSKCNLGNPSPEEIEPLLRQFIEGSRSTNGSRRRPDGWQRCRDLIRAASAA